VIVHLHVVACRCYWLMHCRVSATHARFGNLVEFEIAPGNTANVLAFS